MNEKWGSEFSLLGWPIRSGLFVGFGRSRAQGAREGPVWRRQGPRGRSGTGGAAAA